MSKADLENEVENENEGISEGEAFGNMDFNVEDEYKPDPLAAKATYKGVINGVKFIPSQYCIAWDVCLQDNGGVLNDGQTPIDGYHVFYRNWLPKPGDESELTKSGRNTKRQSKINMLKDFQEKMGIDMSTPVKIATALAEQQWIGIEVLADVDIDEYEGRFKNVVNKMVKMP